MKAIKISLLALTFGLMSFAQVSNIKPSVVTVGENSPIKWKSESIDLGDIPQGKPVNIDFEFVNEGKEAVIITNVHASCGCTATDYTREPVAPGKKATIKATFNAAAKGPFSKTVTVTTNADKMPKTLNFKGTVK